jgi:hypothetical protein
MTEYASQETNEVMTERFPQRDGHLSLIGIRSKIDQEFPRGRFHAAGPIPTGRPGPALPILPLKIFSHRAHRVLRGLTS